MELIALVVGKKDIGKVNVPTIKSLPFRSVITLYAIKLKLMDVQNSYNLKKVSLSLSDYPTLLLRCQVYLK
jgi:hypothetical protein